MSRGGRRVQGHEPTRRMDEARRGHARAPAATWNVAGMGPRMGRQPSGWQRAAHRSSSPPLEKRTNMLLLARVVRGLSRLRGGGRTAGIAEEGGPHCPLSHWGGCPGESSGRGRTRHVSLLLPEQPPGLRRGAACRSTDTEWMASVAEPGGRRSGGGGRVGSSLPSADGAQHGWWSDGLKRNKVRGVARMPGTCRPLPTAETLMARRSRDTALGAGGRTVVRGA